MALKKSELYSSLWQSCDELRGGTDAGQYKDYVLVLLFIKYVSDKYAGKPYAPITIPEGAGFKDMVALKGTSDIGDQINKKIIAPLANANKLSDMPDFNDATKLGSGKEMVDRLTNLIAIFENKALDFSKNRADGDDILGDAYEYLMRHFATESGKSKGQFYTPAEVSRVMAKVLGIDEAKTSASTTVYDPTCGSGSLLLKVSDEADADVTLYGQEKDAATSGLARMNMILHNNPTALIVQGNTLADPKFKDGGALKIFDYVVANPPFSDKRWSTGFDPLNDPHERFRPFGIPPAKQGDYAYLLHIVRSLKTTGKGACILPHGVLFRGNAETGRILVKDTKGKERDKGWTCDLVPKELVVARSFAEDQAAIDRLAAEMEGVGARLTEMVEEHGGEDGAFADLDKVNKAGVTARLKEIKGDEEAKDDAVVLNEWLRLNKEQTALKKSIKEAEAALDARAYARYPKLTEAEIKTLVVDDKWLAALDAAILGEMGRISQALTRRVTELAERYECPMPVMTDRVAELEAKVTTHLERMGFSWE